MKLGALFREAFEKAGVALPEKPAKRERVEGEQSKGKKSQTDRKRKKKPRPKAEKAKGLIRQAPKHVTPVEGKKTTVTKSGVTITRWSSPDLTASQPKKTTNQPVQAAVSQDALPAGSDVGVAASITASADASVTWKTLSAGKPAALKRWPLDGRETALNRTAEEKFLYLGLDFGTSSLKAAITDRERQFTYAVPFRDRQGIAAYLLPCRVYLGDDGYNLDGRGVLFQDLKLALLSSVESSEAQQHVVGFLALALRMIRGWLLSAHGDTYDGIIIWDLAVGLPVANLGDESIVTLYRTVSTAAWIAAAGAQLGQDAIRRAIKRAEALVAGAAPESDCEDIEVAVKPEIAAQIYGFVSSGAYDPNASNIYLLVDVGAGTLDASVFHIKRHKGQDKDRLSIFKTTVEPHGAMNLHRQRMSWLQTTLADQLPDRPDLIEGVAQIRHLTDAEGAIPDNIQGYFQGVGVQFKGLSIDQSFYQKVNAQVVANTYRKVLEEKRLSQLEMKGMPMFLCGGGSRSSFYAKLKDDLQSAPGYSWFGVSPKSLQRPQGLVAPGLPAADYDRLAVAYGLSQLKLERLVEEVPALAEGQARLDFSGNYIEK